MRTACGRCGRSVFCIVRSSSALNMLKYNNLRRCGRCGRMFFYSLRFGNGREREREGKEERIRAKPSASSACRYKSLLRNDLSADSTSKLHRPQAVRIVRSRPQPLVGLPPDGDRAERGGDRRRPGWRPAEKIAAGAGTNGHPKEGSPTPWLGRHGRVVASSRRCVVTPSAATT